MSNPILSHYYVLLQGFQEFLDNHLFSDVKLVFKDNQMLFLHKLVIFTFILFFFGSVILLYNDSGKYIFDRYWQPAAISSNPVSMIKWMRILRPFFYQSLTYLSSGEIKFTFLVLSAASRVDYAQVSNLVPFSPFSGKM